MNLLSANMYIWGRCPSYSDYIFKDYFSIWDRSTAFLDHPIFAKFSTADKTKGQEFLREWLRELDKLSGSFFPDDEYKKIHSGFWSILLSALVWYPILIVLIGMLVKWLFKRALAQTDTTLEDEPEDEPEGTKETKETEKPKETEGPEGTKEPEGTKGL